MTPLRKLFQLSPREAWLLLQAAALLPAVRLALRFTTVSQLRNFSEDAVHDRRASDLSPQATARMVRVAARYGMCRAKCLEQSLALRWLLRRQGFDARILLGARKEDGQIQAHAWVEIDGISLDEEKDIHQTFSRFEKMAASDAN